MASWLHEAKRQPDTPGAALFECHSHSGVFIENREVWGLRSKDVERFGVQFYGDRPFMGLDAPQRVDQGVPMELLAKVTSWLDKQQSPFFLYYAPVEPHVPVTQSRAVADTSKVGPYGDWVHELDRNVGRLMDYLEERGLSENTLLIFTSDDGGEDKPTRKMESVHAIEAGLAINGPWRAGKHTIYEGGFRVPLIARWPGHIQAGTTCDKALNLVDLPATLAAVANQPAPTPEAGFEDSVNRLPALLGRSPEPRTSQVLQNADGVLAVRDGRWKWIEGKPTNPEAPENRGDEFQPQLYDLQSDPGETRNVISLHADVADRLARLLDQTRTAGQSRKSVDPP